VKSKFSAIIFTRIKAVLKHVDEIDPGALNKAFPYLRAPKTHTFQALLGERQQPLPTNTNTFQEKHKKTSLAIILLPAFFLFSIFFAPFPLFF